jgi:hypothetical protein
MDLKFTFSESQDKSAAEATSADDTAANGAAAPGRPLPFAGATTSGSSELFIELEQEHDAIIGRGVSGDDVEYGRTRRPLRDSEPLSTAARSALARVIAEIGDPLVRSLTAIRVSKEVHAALTEIEALDDAGTHTTEVLLRRAGIDPGTAVEIRS